MMNDDTQKSAESRKRKEMTERKKNLERARPVIII
jgi:hypothetical protein